MFQEPDSSLQTRPMWTAGLKDHLMRISSKRFVMDCSVTSETIIPQVRTNHRFRWLCHCAEVLRALTCVRSDLLISAGRAQGALSFSKHWHWTVLLVCQKITQAKLAKPGFHVDAWHVWRARRGHRQGTVWWQCCLLLLSSAQQAWGTQLSKNGDNSFMNENLWQLLISCLSLDNQELSS
jgi:hypothetical protein